VPLAWDTALIVEEFRRLHEGVQARSTSRRAMA
jgi:hypothetical protein